MICVGKHSAYAIIAVFIICLQSIAVWGRESKGDKALNSGNGALVSADGNNQFQWSDHKKLSWDDFRGIVHAANDESAAATHCGIGFRTQAAMNGDKPEIVVYNTFYAEKSWVRSDAKLPSILVHEQGHFDLCEIYTRKLRDRMSKFDFNVPDIRQALMSIYSQLSNEYEKRQQDYEQETIHGTDLLQQKRWLEIIARELL